MSCRPAASPLMSSMAAEPPPRLDSVLSFGNTPMPGDDDRPAEEEVPHTLDFSDDDDDAGFEFAFAPPLGGSPGSAAPPDLAPADDLFAHPAYPAYPVFDRHLLLDRDDEATTPASSAAPQGPSTAPASPDNYCAWAPRSAPGSPAREFPKSASTGESSSRRFRGLRGLVSGRSHSDGKEKFLFLQPAAATATTPSKMSGSKAEAATAKPSSPAQQKQSKRKGGKAAAADVTEMDMATAHRLFYGKPGAGAGALAGDRKQQQSYLPYRPGIVGFFTAAHALGGRSHHPY